MGSNTKLSSKINLSVEPRIVLPSSVALTLANALILMLETRKIDLLQITNHGNYASINCFQDGGEGRQARGTDFYEKVLLNSSLLGKYCLSNSSP